MNRLSSKAFAALLLAAGSVLASSAQGLEFKAVEAPVAVLFDAPSQMGKKLFLLKRYTPVEVIVSLEGFVKVREPEGAIGWVDKKVLTERRQVLVSVARAQVRAAPVETAAVVFEAEKGVAMELVEPPREGWAKVKHVDGQAGVVRVTQVWGL
jgi:SH3-like domain-containing protein